MHELRRCFITLSGDDLGSTTLVFKLFSKTLPQTTEHFAQLCRGEFGPNADSYRDSKVVRVVAPEYLVQLGGLSNDPKGVIVDNNEYTSQEPQIRTKLGYRKPGLLCVVGGGGGPESNSAEFFVTLDNLSKYSDKELKGYLIIGELEKPNVDELNLWLKRVKVDDNDRPLTRCSISHCGELVKRR